MKKYIVYTLLFVSNSLWAQSDTLCSQNGKYIRIKYSVGKCHQSAFIRNFKSSNNHYDQNKPLFDTLYFNGFRQKEGATRTFLHELSYIKIFRKSYDYIFPEFQNIGISVTYYDDTTISNFSVGYYDSCDNWIANKMILSLNFQQGTKFSSDKYKHTVIGCKEDDSIELVFSESNHIEKLYLYHKNSGIYYEFYNNFRCKKHGYFTGNIPVGEWTEYHKNGNISSVKTEKTIKYFDENGNAIEK